MPKREFLLEGSYLGAGDQALDSGNHGEAPSSYAFFCPDPDCGRIWALAPIASRAFQVWNQPCGRQHGDDLEAYKYRETPAGSIWLPWDSDYLAAMPVAVLRRELTLLLDRLEKQNEL